MPSHADADQSTRMAALCAEMLDAAAPAERRVRAAEALGGHGAEHLDAIPPLIEALGQDDARVLVSVARALGRIGPPARDAVPALEAALAAEDAAVRLNAALALRQIDPSARVSVDTLIDALTAGASSARHVVVDDADATAARALAAFEEIGSAIRSSLDLDEVLDVIGRTVIEYGDFRSLMIALVDEDAGEVRVDRDFVRDATGAVARGGAAADAVTYALSDPDPVAEAARTGVLVITEGWDARMSTRNAGTVTAYTDDKAAYFIPVAHEGRTLAVLATASARDRREATIRRIAEMGSQLCHAGAALGYARVHRRMTLLREELSAVVAGARCLLWQARVRAAASDVDGEPRLDWDVRVSDEEAALRFLPLDTSGGRSYIQAWHEAMGAAEVARVSETARRAILSGHSGYEVEHTCADATGAERWLNDQVFVERIADGEWRCVGVCSDITESKRSERALRDSESRFRSVFTQGPLGMAIVGPDFRLVDANDMLCRIVGYSREELHELRFADFTHEGDIAMDVELMRQVFAGDIPHYTVEKRYVRKDGAPLWGKLTATVIGGTPGQPLHGLNMLEDITERKRAELEAPDVHAQLERRIEERTAEIEDELAERIRVEGALRTTERERSRLMHQVLSVQEVERARIARELHDQTGQALSSLLIGLRVVERAASLDVVKKHASDLRDVTSQALDSVRTLAFDMRPTSLENLGLSAGIEREASALGSQLGVHVAVHADPGVDGLLPRDAETAVYRVIHAALTNIGRHANASVVSILLRRREGMLTALVEDDGVGFDVEKTLRGPIEGRFGLLAMEERVRPFKGVVSFESVPDEGATVYVQMPTDPTAGPTDA